ncbi:hypothetical protein HDV57DRAFT_133479 [Trichoderma longibrachiatum]|uniref:Uncharacterized protein n=1 Tax=Trichoderma longibrachiatum ATCC 18648 TaxID=983965 RepID=A0A2T4BRU5_TRILO|nr:hypothetical protein M440DRAFT_166068 [Trichoderma longibrachiatum ATCC 18648]
MDGPLINSIFPRVLGCRLGCLGGASYPRYVGSATSPSRYCCWNRSGQPRSPWFPPLEPLSLTLAIRPAPLPSSQRRTWGLPASNPGGVPRGRTLLSEMLPRSARSFVRWAHEPPRWALFGHQRPSTVKSQKPTLHPLETHHPDRPSSRYSDMLLLVTCNVHPDGLFHGASPLLRATRRHRCL